MADTRYLVKRGRTWHVRVSHPPKEWHVQGEFWASLGTGDLHHAQRLRDKYLLPILAEASAAGMLTALAGRVAAADESIARQLREFRNGLVAGGTDVMIRELTGKFITYLESAQAYAPATVQKYRTDLHAICARLGGDQAADALTRPQVAALRDELLTLPRSWQRLTNGTEGRPKGEPRLSATTVGRILGRGQQLFAWAIREQAIGRQDNPFAGITVARTVTTHKRPPTLAEAHELLALPRPQRIEALTWEALPVFARYTGCRVGELAQLEAADVVVEQGIRCLRITARGGRQLKTPGSERLVPVSERLAPHLDRVLAERRRGPLFRAEDYHDGRGGVKYAHGFLKQWNRRAKTVAPDLTFHGWRVYASDAMATGGVDELDRERLLGHTSQRTLAAYTPENLQRLKRAVDTIP